jgi:hypothetical protein
MIQELEHYRILPNFLTTYGIISILLYFAVIFMAFAIYSSKKYQNEPNIKKYFRYGLLIKVSASICFSLLYDFYYHWDGDSGYYFLYASRLGDVFFNHPGTYFKILFGFVNPGNIHEIDPRHGYLPSFRDPSILALHRYVSLFTIIGLKNYYLTNMVLNTFLFFLNWKVFEFFRKLFPDKTKIFAIALLFIPSVTFWSSGILKDSFTFTFTLLFIVYAHRLLFQRKISLFNILKLLFCAYILIQLKPYILFSAIGGMFVWLGFSYTYLIKSQFLRVFVLPIILILVAIGSSSALGTLMTMAGGHYSDMDTMLNKAVVSQQDLKQDYYEGSSFDIGDYEPSLTGVVSVAPAAIIAGLYRPFIWEARSLVMLLSGLENSIVLILTLYILFRAGPMFLIKTLASEPFLIFCFIFVITMSLGIGMSTSNFGALVRFKIPMMPFLVIALLWIRAEHKKFLINSNKSRL